VSDCRELHLVGYTTDPGSGTRAKLDSLLAGLPAAQPDSGVPAGQ